MEYSAKLAKNVNHREQNYEHENLAKNPPLHTPDTDGEIFEEDKEIGELSSILLEAVCWEFGIDEGVKWPIEEFRNKMLK